MTASLAAPATSRSTKNRVHGNNKFCPAAEGSPPLSGGGIVLVGVVRTRITDNQVNDNSSGGTLASGGIVLISAALTGGADESHNTVADNDLHRNQRADIVWDGSGTDNRFIDNDCASSIPPGLCHP